MPIAQKMKLLRYIFGILNWLSPEIKETALKICKFEEVLKEKYFQKEQGKAEKMA